MSNVSSMFWKGVVRVRLFCGRVPIPKKIPLESI
jgi:hypothetical protein